MVVGIRKHRARRNASAVSAILAAAAAAIVALAPPATATATAVIIGTTFIPDPSQPSYLHGAMEYYVKPMTVCGVQPCAIDPAMTPEQLWPFSGLQDMTIDQSIAQGLQIVDGVLRDRLAGNSDPIVVFGDSQSSTILTLEKRNLAELPDDQKKRLIMVLVANPNRPNGGLLERIAPFTIPVFDLAGSGATPTNTGIQTIDIVGQYDAIADFPRYPLNILADLNLIAGAAIHSSYMTGPAGYTEEELIDAIGDPRNQQTYGDTLYVTIPAKQLPLLVPLRTFGKMTGLSAVTTPLADLVEPTLRVLVELGYDRSIPRDEPTGFGLFPQIDPATVAFDLSSAVRSGIKTALSDIGVNTPVAAPPAAAAKATRSATPARPSLKPKPASVAASALPVSRPSRVERADRHQVRSNASRQAAPGPRDQARP